MSVLPRLKRHPFAAFVGLVICIVGLWCLYRALGAANEKITTLFLSEASITLSLGLIFLIGSLRSVPDQADKKKTGTIVFLILFLLLMGGATKAVMLNLQYRKACVESGGRLHGPGYSGPALCQHGTRETTVLDWIFHNTL